MADVELIQFPYSHYNEKARWGFDYKRVPHTRRSLLPGPHMFQMRRWTGQTQVPAARFDDAYVCGSARILDELEKRHPEPALYPADPALRERALEIQRRFDDEIGPAVRTGLFSHLLDELGYLCAMFAAGRSGPSRALYRTTLPLVAPLMRHANGVTGPADVERAMQVTRDGFDFVAANAGPDGYLVGDRFSIADLAAAALLAPATNPPDSAMTRPQPAPPTIVAWMERWSDHPGTAWVLDMYRRHRPTSTATGRGLGGI